MLAIQYNIRFRRETQNVVKKDFCCPITARKIQLPNKIKLAVSCDQRAKLEMISSMFSIGIENAEIINLGGCVSG